MVFTQYNKVMVFIDGSYVFHCCRELHFILRYEKFLNILKKDKNVIRVYYYSGTTPTSSENFMRMLKHLGVEVKTKLLRERTIKCKFCNKEFKTSVEKGIDASLSTDLLWFAFQNAYDTGIVITGDADFIPPIERAKDIGKRIEIWAFEHSLDNELRNIADSVKIIDTIIDKIKKK